MSAFEITRFRKSGGPLTKRISLSDTGTLISDGSACVMVRGTAERVRLGSLVAFADVIRDLETDEAIALGALRGDLPEHVQVVTQDRLAALNGAAPPNLIARTANHIVYAAGSSALALIDVDTKGMPDDVKARVRDGGGFWTALTAVLPALAHCGYIVRRSTSTGIGRNDTGDKFFGSNGMHIYIPVLDGTDIERFLRTLHERCWLAGYGWHIVGAGGQLLDRSLVDRTVYAAERLVFEASPILMPPLVQDVASREPAVTEGPALNTVDACPPLRIVEASKLGSVRNSGLGEPAPVLASCGFRGE